ncbi:MAG: hypothetical protein IJC17_05775 [Clostridia bacterium]|nr:hypothetical protein [Clostridia bacterium]
MDKNRRDEEYELNLIVAEVLGTPPPAPPEPEPEAVAAVAAPVTEAPEIRPVSEPGVVHSPAPTKPESEPEEDVLVYLPKTSVGSEPEPTEDEDIKIAPVRIVEPEPSTADARTQVMPAEIVEDLPEEDDNQLRLEGFDPPKPEPPRDDRVLEEQLRQNREQKVSSFRMRLSGEEEFNEPDEEPDVYETDYIEDFADYEDADVIRNELEFRLGKSRLTLVAAIVLELGLLLVNVLGRFGLLGAGLVYTVVSILLYAVMVVVCNRTFKSGLADLRDGDPSSDTAAAAVAMLAAVQIVTTVFDPTTAPTVSLAVVGGVAMFISAWAHERQLRQVAQNFRFVGHTGTKTACHRIDDEKLALEIGHDAVASGVPDVAYYRPASFLTHYLSRSYERADNRQVSRIFIPIMAGAALVAAVVFGVLNKDWMGALRLFVVLLALGQPLSLGVGAASALTRVSARILRAGGLLVGRADAADFARVHALAVDAIELFPGECVLLNGIKTFSGTRIDDAIVDAASVSIAAGGPLSEVFRRIIENKTELLHEVETLTYEQEMGLSGWVNGRRVLVGNRRLLENHGVDVPSRDYEMRYSKGDRQLVYLSTAGELSAMFVITYTRSEEIAKAVKQLAAAHITLLVRTCDPNITAELICRTLDADDYYIEILGSTARRRYEQLVGNEPIEEPAGIASNGRIEGQAAALTGCRRLHAGLAVVQISAMVIAACLFALIALSAFLQPALPLSSLSAVLYILSGLVAILILPMLLGS